LLDQLTTEGVAETKSAILLLLNELILWKYYNYMGPALRNEWLKDITRFPDWLESGVQKNSHVNRECYIERWGEEIQKIGGFEHLTDEKISIIRNKLWEVFGVEKWNSSQQ
jgi:hypothetical protein